MTCVSGWRRWKPAMSSSRSAESFTLWRGVLAELLQQRPFHQLEPLGDLQDLADAPRDLCRALIRSLIGERLDRRGVGGYAEQAGASLIVQFVGDLAALFFLHADELTIEPAVLVPRRAKRGRERVEDRK